MIIKKKVMDIQTILIIILVGVAAGMLSGLVGAPTTICPAGPQNRLPFTSTACALSCMA